MSITIPLSRLVASSRNVRKTGKDARLEELKSSIYVHGLINNLLVAQIGDDANTATYEVVAGGRRLLAMQQMSDEGMIDAEFPVLCKICDDDQATQVSLAENVVRTAMHPADQYEAFQKLADEGQSVSAIANSFGVSEKLVNQRLKLANVNPVLIQEFREEKMTLETLMTFTICDDHAKQESVWQVYKRPRDLVSNYFIKSALTEDKICGNNPKAKFIGEEDYLAAGGNIERDLFGEDVFFTDVEVLEKLALEKVQSICIPIKKEGWKWVESHITSKPSFNDVYGNFGRFFKKKKDLTEEEETEFAKLQEELDAISAEHEIDYEDEHWFDALPIEVCSRYCQICSRIDELERKAEGDFPAEIKARCGVVIVLNYKGELEYHYGLMRPEDRTLEEVAQDKGRNVKEKSRLSAAFHQELTAHYNQALSCTLADKPDIALTALLHTMIKQVFYSYKARNSALTVSHQAVSYDEYETVKGCLAKMMLEEKKEEWSSIIPECEVERWEWLVSLKQKKRIELLAFCVSQTVDTIRPKHQSPVQYQRNLPFLVKQVPIDMTYYWEPTASNYTSQVTKAILLEDLTKQCGVMEGKYAAARSKKELVPLVAKALEGKGWLPPELKPLESVISSELSDDEENAEDDQDLDQEDEDMPDFDIAA